MPTKREREYYRMGYQDGLKDAIERDFDDPIRREFQERGEALRRFSPFHKYSFADVIAPKKRKLSAWNKYVKANSKKPRFRYKSGSKKGKLNLKKMAIAFRKTPAGRKRKR